MVTCKMTKNLLFISIICLFIFLGGCKEEPVPPPPPGGCQVADTDLTAISYSPVPFIVNLPTGFPPLIERPENPLTEAGVDLGRKLFYDPILSVDSTKSCFSCHEQSKAFSRSLR